MFYHSDFSFVNDPHQIFDVHTHVQFAAFADDYRCGSSPSSREFQLKQWRHESSRTPEWFSKSA
jgi:hypothetical protein